MDIKFFTPDDIVIRNLDKGDNASMFMIAKGECKAIIQTSDPKENEESDDEQKK